MKLQSIRVQNYRSILDESISFADLTALVGRNGAGKSAFLSAIDLFYSTSDSVTVSDFYNDDPQREISITATFSDLSLAARELFSTRVQGNTLTVEKIISWNDGRCAVSYHGSTLQHPEIARIREAVKLRDRGKTAMGILEELRRSGEYEDLPEWTTIGDTLEALQHWEKEHPEHCERLRDDGQFFGFRQVGQGYLGRFTRRLFIRAVSDPSKDAAEGRGTVFSELMDLVVRSALRGKAELEDLRDRLQEELEGLISPENAPELEALQEQLTSTLQTFVPSSEVRLRWMPIDQLDLPMPIADMKIVEDGYAAPVANCGHGLQRAFLLTMLQHLTLASYHKDQVEAEAEEDSGDGDRVEVEDERQSLPGLVLLIEEPELYQHPSRQRHLASILWKLAGSEGLGVAEHTQVIYSTHSPHFVGLDRIEGIRLLRKVPVSPDLPKQTSSIQVDLDEVAAEIWDAAGRPGERFTGETLRPRLAPIMTPWMNEGFFSDVAVLVEGENDRAALLGMAIQMGLDLDSAGVSVIPCGGKNNIDRPAAIFRSLGIPVYPIWDSDRGEYGASSEPNQRLLRLLGEQPEDWPAGVYGTYACFENDLETAMENELGSDYYDNLVTECQSEYGFLKKKHAMKNPHVVSRIIERSSKDGFELAFLRRILENVLAMREGNIEAIEV